MVNNKPTGFKELLDAMMKRRWFISAIVLGGFMIIIGGIFASIMVQTPMSTEWKELLLLLLGAFIGSYGKIIDYWFSDTDKDKMLVQKMDEEDGITLSDTGIGGGVWVSTLLFGGAEEAQQPVQQAAPVININNTQTQSNNDGGKTIIIKEKSAPATEKKPVEKKKDEFTEEEPKW